MKKLLTLCLVCDDRAQPPRVLLGMKKRGFGAGRWNGFGGKVHVGETILAAAYRELSEEASITALDMAPIGPLEFAFKGNPEIMEVHVFRTERFSGEPAESDEMRPQWFAVGEIPFAEMWSDDRHWFPLALAGKTFRGRFEFDGEETITGMTLAEAPVESFQSAQETSRK